MPKEYIPSIDANLTYINKDTFIHRWNPKAKIVSCVLGVFLISSIKTPKYLIACFLGLLILVLLMGLGPRELLRKTSLLLPFIIFMSLPILFGKGLKVDPERKELVILLAFKSLSSLYLMFLMFFSQPMWEFFGALSYLKVPDTVMSIIFLSWRYVFVLGAKLRNMYRALSSRLFVPKFNKATFNTMGQVMGGMLIKSLDTSDTVYNAMVSRGFDNKIPVSEPRKLQVMDLAKSLGLIIPVVVVLIIERW